VSAYPDPSPSYQSAYQQSIQDPSAFWTQAAEAISWYDTSGPTLRYNSQQQHDYTWFPDRSLNTAYNCLDLHCQHGRSEQAAIIYDSPVTGVKQRLSYGELLEQVSKLAGAMRAAGVGMSDVVMVSIHITYLPWLPPTSHYQQPTY
jgi:propionyl-CoA synthetase